MEAGGGGGGDFLHLTSEFKIHQKEIIQDEETPKKEVPEKVYDIILTQSFAQNFSRFYDCAKFSFVCV